MTIRAGGSAMQLHAAADLLAFTRCPIVGATRGAAFLALEHATILNPARPCGPSVIGWTSRLLANCK
jgi:hypothetical protein